LYFKWLEHYYTLKNHSLHTVLSWCLFTVGCSTKKGTLLSWKLYQVGFSIWPIPLLCGPYKSIVRVNWKKPYICDFAQQWGQRSKLFRESNHLYKFNTAQNASWKPYSTIYISENLRSRLPARDIQRMWISWHHALD